jgi:hypothetical protein
MLSVPGAMVPWASATRFSASHPKKKLTTNPRISTGDIGLPPMRGLMADPTSSKNYGAREARFLWKTPIIC